MVPGEVLDSYSCLHILHGSGYPELPTFRLAAPWADQRVWNVSGRDRNRPSLLPSMPNKIAWPKVPGSQSERIPEHTVHKADTPAVKCRLVVR